MTPYFADTFYFLALVNPRDESHDKVSKLNASLRRPLLTTAWVLTEVGDALARTPNRALFSRLLAKLQTNPRAVILPPTVELFQEGVNLYGQRSDKDWSLTDCISFVAMRAQGLTDALTADHHFEQAGFVALLK